MVYQDDQTVKIDDVILPGLVKSMEIKNDAQVDEQEVEGQSKKPKQATGYEDAKINIELILEDTQDDAGTVTMTRMQKLQQIQALFRQPGQALPAVHQIVCEDTAVRGISQVILKNMTHKAENKKQQITASLELWEYNTLIISAGKSASSSGAKKDASASTGAGSVLNEDYKSYLKDDRGTAPARKETERAAGKLSQSPQKKAAAQVTPSASAGLGRIEKMPF